MQCAAGGAKKWGQFFAVCMTPDYHPPMTRSIRLLLSAILCASSTLASAQVFRCADSTGKVQFSDKPCAAGQQASEVKIYKDPVALPAQKTAAEVRMSPAAVEYEKKREQRRQQSSDSHRRMDGAAGEVRQIKAANFDPAKCSEARGRMARMEQLDPLLHKSSPDYFEFQQKASLYCGS